MVLRGVLDEDRRAAWERWWGGPIESFVERWAAVTYFVLELADQARALLRVR